MSYGMIFLIVVVLLLGWLHSSRKEAARQDVDRRIVPAVLDAALQQVQFTPNGRITCFGESGLPLPRPTARRRPVSGNPGFPCPSMTA